MARIRDDLDGSVYLHLGGPAGPVILFAGDAVPDGATVGEHLLADPDLDLQDDVDEDLLEVGLQLTELGIEPEGEGVADESGGPQPEAATQEEPPLAPVVAEPDQAPAKRSHRKA